MAEGKIRVEDHLVDANNKPIQVRYTHLLVIQHSLL